MTEFAGSANDGVADDNSVGFAFITEVREGI
jgi:hypothetical protein